MALNSVHTNTAALVALQGLNRTNTELLDVQGRVNSGFRIAKAKDDGAAFSIAQGLRADRRGYEAISEQLSKAVGTMSVANEAARQISDTLADVRAVITKLADENVSGDQRTQYHGDYINLKAEILRYIQNADFNGVNMLDNTAGIDIISTLEGGIMTMRSFDLDTNVHDVLPTITAGDAATVAQAALTATGGLSNAEANLGTAMSTLGSDTKSLENHLNYVGILGDATEEGIGAIVDADLAKESARLQALQVRQQLGTQTLSIANQAPQILLTLFRS
jgi:flagellin